MEHAPLVFALAPLGRVVPVHLLVTHVAELGTQLAGARPRRPVALAPVPVEANVDEVGLARRLPLGPGVGLLIRFLHFRQLRLRPC